MDSKKIIPSELVVTESEEVKEFATADLLEEIDEEEGKKRLETQINKLKEGAK